MIKWKLQLQRFGISEILVDKIFLDDRFDGKYNLGNVLFLIEILRIIPQEDRELAIKHILKHKRLTEIHLLVPILNLYNLSLENTDILFVIKSDKPLNSLFDKINNLLFKHPNNKEVVRGKLWRIKSSFGKIDKRA